MALGSRTPREVIDAARAEGGDEALTDLPAIALGVTLLDGYDPSNPETLTGRSVLVEPIVHPVLEALLDRSPATRRGRYTWSFGLGDDCNPAPLAVALRAVRLGSVIPKDALVTPGGRPRDGRLYTWRTNLQYLLGGFPLLRETYATWSNTLTAGQRMKLNDPQELGTPNYSALILSIDGRSLYMKAVTRNLAMPEGEGWPDVNLNLVPPGRSRTEPKPVLGCEVAQVIDWARMNNIPVYDLSGTGVVAQLRRTAERSLCVRPYPGRPAEALVSVGRKLKAATAALDAKFPGGSYSANALCGTTSDSVAAVVALCEGDPVYVHPAVADVAAMSVAGPFDDPVLRKFQPEAVGLHLATNIGMVNTMGPGVGKTITSLRAMRARSMRQPGYRGLVIAEANIREQWVREIDKFWPEAARFSLETRTQAEDLRSLYTTTGAGPLVVVTSYALAAMAAKAALPKESATAVAAEHIALPDPGQLLLFDPDAPTAAELGGQSEPEDGGDPLGQALLTPVWDDIIADEAIGLRNGSTKLADALWALRARSKVAVALTGTPIEKGLDDLGAMIAWARNDPYLFWGNRLSANFDVTTREGVRGLLRALGPLVYRVDTSEIADELPPIEAEVVRLLPSGAEKNLADAARGELKRAYTELISALEIKERAEAAKQAGAKLDIDEERYSSIKTALRSARGAWLGGTTLARMSASDPAALIGSESAGAALLIAEGLVAAATKVRGTKRAWAVDYCTRHVGLGERVLLFTDFATVAEGLIADFRAAGLRTGACLGGGGKARDRDIASFQARELDVLVATKSGERGLNLQAATTVIHYDMPWVPSSVLQRTGRVERRGSTSARVKIVFPIMSGTIEERVAAMVVARAVLSMLALDTHRGVKAQETLLGRALGGLVTDVDAKQLTGKEHSMLDMTRELLAV